MWSDDEENEEMKTSDDEDLNYDEENEKNVPTLTVSAIQFVSDDQIQVIQQLWGRVRLNGLKL